MSENEKKQKPNPVPQGVRVCHLRHITNDNGEQVIHPRGGVTVAIAEVAGQSNLYHIALAWCNPSDNYNFVYGRSKALGRLAQKQARPDEDVHQTTVSVHPNMEAAVRATKVNIARQSGYRAPVRKRRTATVDIENTDAEGGLYVTLTTPDGVTHSFAPPVLVEEAAALLGMVPPSDEGDFDDDDE